MEMYTKARKIIINADDFGMSAEANKAIIEAFEKNVISSTTVMANMPGFHEACELAHRHRLIGKVGVHLNLTSGYPLSDSIRECAQFCDRRGMFRPRQTMLFLSKEESMAATSEIEAQINACVDEGLCPTHIDSHHHIHTEWPIGKIVIAVARRHDIKAIRLSRNCGSGISIAHRLYKWGYNTRLKAYGLAKTQYFGSACDVQEILTEAFDAIEVMVHLTSECAEAHTDFRDQNGIERSILMYKLADYS